VTTRMKILPTELQAIGGKMKMRTRRVRLCAITSLVLFFAVTSRVTCGQSGTASSPASEPVQLTVSGDVKNPLSLSLDDLRRLPRKTISVQNEHAAENEVYEGTPLEGLLKQAGATLGSQLRGKAMATYILAEGADGYRVIYSLAELDGDFQVSDVIVADTMDGKPLGDKLGPLRLVAPHDKRPARWVRMLHSIQVVNVSQ
jgi:DMSO/TMAO reductase YedYZ molybdopterin-dependent catalytic subunit